MATTSTRPARRLVAEDGALNVFIAAFLPRLRSVVVGRTNLSVGGAVDTWEEAKATLRAEGFTLMGDWEPEPTGNRHGYVIRDWR